ncbi:hypothetical protein [Flavobacterium terrigena]|uniref:CarboxypepD_reg-like domain-containing protein n=1 Tax=Flavobacterium terrigena TaxID=402734 RepID=A0A1H6SUZ1_9FLAO|nr:hypothetical protein [Flavobacterium terrigena]SEI69604.1 hypothetical protein SAMN05660918_1446 [Flavobacterium terrigena]
MKKQFSLKIENPCDAKFSEMTPNANGSFCSSCAKTVIDLSRKTNSEVAKILANSKDSNICARLKTSQLDQVFEHNEASKLNTFKYATAIAASVLLTSNVIAQEKEPAKIEVDGSKPQRIMGKIAYKEPVNTIKHQPFRTYKVVSFSIQGKLLDSKTNKPISEKLYPNLSIYINGAQKNLKIDAKTGKFEVPVVLSENATEISVHISNDDKNYNNTFQIDLKMIKNNKLNLNIYINPEEELQKYMIMGGLGINNHTSKNYNS